MQLENKKYDAAWKCFFSEEILCRWYMRMYTVVIIELSYKHGPISFEQDVLYTRDVLYLRDALYNKNVLCAKDVLYLKDVLLTRDDLCMQDMFCTQEMFGI